MSNLNKTQEAEKNELPKNPNTETVTFESPIKRGESEIASVDIRKPKTGALRGLKLGRIMELDVDSLIVLVSRISSPPITEHEVAELDPADFVSVSTVVLGFFANSTQKKEVQATN